MTKGAPPPLTVDQLDALRCFSSLPEAVALVTDPTAAAITTMGPVDGYWIAGAMSGGHIGPDGIRVTLRDSQHVTITVPELQAWSRALPDWVRIATDDDGRRTFFHQFTMARCANPNRPARHTPSTGGNPVRVIRICRTPWSKYAAIEKAIGGIINVGMDFPYPCRWCMRWIIYRDTDTGMVDTAVAELNTLGVILEDLRTPLAEPEPEYEGQGELFHLAPSGTAVVA
ncbi:hypothetical protein [Tsukamurella sp. 1534]|uniref:hypothetical protein n=1 Tax=Tsukamurella sp. 1534 TaxID=1151061 RepID=UPI0002D9CCAB|nr:hypothetical protein [Tsukamurella sp. 1534]